METLSTVASSVGLYFTTGVRWVFLFLAILILARQLRSLLKAKNPSEIWAYLGCPDDSSVPLTHWENLMGRGRGCDVILNLKSVSRTHGILIRDSKGVWKYKDLNSKNGSAINGMPVKEPTELKAGDILTIGGSDFTLYPVSLQERMDNIEKRKQKTHSISPWPTLFAITLFQVFTIIQFKISLGESFPASLPAAFILLCILMWAYVIFMRMFKRVGFEMEMIAFFLSTLSLAVTTSAYPSTVFKQSICVCLGVGMFFGLCWLLRDLNRAKKLTYIFIGVSVLLLIVNLILGNVRYGAQNWISIGGFSIQPSELVKIVFIYIGAATLDELQQKKNLTIFMGFSVFCLGCLAIMGDFGTAIIFFVTFLIISFLRSGDFTKLILIIGAAGLMGMMVLRFKPYVATRFETWGHVWEVPTEGGFQQVQTMTSSASGGLLGLGAGEGNLSDVAAASTDLVFGLLTEEWGLIIAILSVLCIITLGVFAVRAIIAGRSTYYSIAACGASSMFIFQTILNVFGSVDLLPLTGVTFPFISSGGTSMIASWGMLAFLKAADTRQNASFAIRLDKKGEFESEMESRGPESPEEIFDAVGYEEGYEDGYWQSYKDGLQENQSNIRQDYKIPRDDGLDSLNLSSERYHDKTSARSSSRPQGKSAEEDFWQSYGNAPFEGQNNAQQQVPIEPRSGLNHSNQTPYSKASSGSTVRPRSSDLAHSPEKPHSKSPEDDFWQSYGNGFPDDVGKLEGSYDASYDEYLQLRQDHSTDQKHSDEDEPLSLDDLFGGDKR